MKISDNFDDSEFACPCCGKVEPIHPDLIKRLQKLRDRLGEPVYISSGGGLRCKKYNKQIKGYTRSPQLLGKAVDIHVKGYDIYDLAILARRGGFTRIGLYPDNHFIHVDTVRPWKNASWVRRKGIYIYYKTLEIALEKL